MAASEDLEVVSLFSVLRHSPAVVDDSTWIHVLQHLDQLGMQLNMLEMVSPWLNLSPSPYPELPTLFSLNAAPYSPHEWDWSDKIIDRFLRSLQRTGEPDKPQHPESSLGWSAADIVIFNENFLLSDHIYHTPEPSIDWIFP